MCEKSPSVCDKTLKPRIKVCSNFMFAFASTSPSKFNIASIETETHRHRIGLNPFLTFYIDVDANANANVKCEHTFIPGPQCGKSALVFDFYRPQ